MAKTQSIGEIKEDRRRSFRVNDVLSLVCRRIDPGQPHLGSRILPGCAEDYLFPETDDTPPDESVSPHLWRLLVQIQNRLGLIISKLDLCEQAVARAEPRKASLSTTGAKFTTPERYAAREFLELKILLPLDPPLWIAVYGTVLRSLESKEGLCETAVEFMDMEDSVTEAINRYGLKRQRDLIRKRKGE